MESVKEKVVEKLEEHERKLNTYVNMIEQDLADKILEHGRKFKKIQNYVGKN